MVSASGRHHLTVVGVLEKGTWDGTSSSAFTRSPPPALRGGCPRRSRFQGSDMDVAEAEVTSTLLQLHGIAESDADFNS